MCVGFCHATMGISHNHTYFFLEGAVIILDFFLKRRLFFSEIVDLLSPTFLYLFYPSVQDLQNNCV